MIPTTPLDILYETDFRSCPNLRMNKIPVQPGITAERIMAAESKVGRSLTIVFVFAEKADVVALGLFDLSQLGDDVVVLTTHAGDISSFTRANNLDESSTSSTLFLHVGLCNSPGGLRGVVLASSAVTDTDCHAGANENLCSFMSRLLEKDWSWVVLPIDPALQKGVADTVNRMWLERDQAEKTKPAPDVMQWAAKTGFFEDPANPTLDKKLCAEMEMALICYGQFIYSNDTSTYKQVTVGRLKTVQCPSKETKPTYGIAGFDATTCPLYMMLSALGFRYFMSIKAAQPDARIKVIESRCLSISAAIFVAKQWIKERRSVMQNTRTVFVGGDEAAAGGSVIQNTRTVFLSGDEVGNVYEAAAAAGSSVIQNAGTMNLSGNAIGNVFGDVRRLKVVQNTGTITRKDKAVANFVNLGGGWFIIDDKKVYIP